MSKQNAMIEIKLTGNLSDAICNADEQENESIWVICALTMYAHDTKDDGGYTVQTAEQAKAIHRDRFCGNCSECKCCNTCPIMRAIMN